MLGQFIDLKGLFRTRNKTMIKINIHEAKTHLSRHLARLAKGESMRTNW